MAFETELETYKAKLPELLSSEGKYVVIRGKELLGVFDAYADALKSGYEKFGTETFLVKRIATVEQAAYFSRPLSACHN